MSSVSGCHWVIEMETVQLQVSASNGVRRNPVRPSLLNLHAVRGNVPEPRRGGLVEAFLPHPRGESTRERSETTPFSNAAQSSPHYCAVRCGCIDCDPLFAGSWT